MKKFTKTLLAAGLALSMAACSSSTASNTEEESTTWKEQTLLVAAAASLKNAYDNELIPMFEEANPGLTVDGTYASSGDLQTQIEGGLDADIFMSAALKQMDALCDEDLIDTDTRVDLLENKIVLIVPEDSTLEITSFEDLKNLEDGVILAIGDPESVPAGQYAKESLETLGIWADVEDNLSLGTDVTAVLNQVAQGSAECGIVYATDAASIEGVKVIAEAPADSLATPVIYPVAVVKASTKSDAAKAFVDFLQTDEALAVFEKYGFTINK